MLHLSSISQTVGGGHMTLVRHKSKLEINGLEFAPITAISLCQITHSFSHTD